MWNKISIRKLNELYAIIENDSLDPVDKEIGILSSLTGNSKEFYEAMPIEVLTREFEKTRFLNDLTSIPRKIPKRFYCGGVLFDIQWEINKWSQSQRRDIDAITGNQFIAALEVQNKSQYHYIDSLHKLVSIIAIPRKFWIFKGKEPAGKRYEDLFWNELPVSVAYPLGVFFCKLSAKFLESIQSYLEEEIGEIVKHELMKIKGAENLLMNIGGGQKYSTN